MKFMVRILPLFLVLLAQVVVDAQDSEAPVDWSPLEDVINSELKRQNTPGLAIAIVHHDTVVYRAGFGVRNQETQDPVTPDTLFRIGSTTKPLTALGVLMLAEQGKLDLDAPVSQYLPQLKIGDAITLRHLLSHSAGLNDDANPYGALNPEALRESIPTFTEQAIFSAAGTVRSYSNPGYNIAGAVIEAVSGQFYADYMANVVFPALKMERTTLYSNMAMTYPLAVGHAPGLLSIVTLNTVRPNADNVAEYPAGFVYSSVNDLAQLARFIMRGDASLISEAQHRVMTHTVETRLNSAFGYGLGLMTSDYRGTSRVGHDGKIEGYTSFLETLPEHEFGVIMLANNITFDPTPIFDAAVDLALTLPAAVEPAPFEATINIQDYVGQYDFGSRTGADSVSIEIKIEDDKLLVDVPGQATFELKAIAADRFMGSFGSVTVGPLDFIREESGEVAYLTVGARTGTRAQ